MRRPLFVLSVFVVLCVVLLFRIYPDQTAEPPDKSRLILYGEVVEKREGFFTVRLHKVPQELYSDLVSDVNFQMNVAVLRRDNPNQQFYNGAYKKFQCEYEDTSVLVLGSRIVIAGELQEYGRAKNPGEFDYSAYYHALDYGGRLQNVSVIMQDAPKTELRELLYRIRCYWEKRLHQIFPQKEASIMTAMLLGDKSDLDTDIKLLYRKAGIIHILSISGLHITLIGVGFYNRLRRLGVPVWIAAFVGGVLLFLYGMLTGFGISACRAIIMYWIRMLSHIVGRTYDMLTALGVVAAGMVCMHPAWSGHMGFLLSFGSVLGVAALLPELQSGITVMKEETRHRLTEKKSRYVEEGWRRLLIDSLRKGGEIFRRGFGAGLSVTLTTLPIQLWFSYEISVYSLFLNMLILPFMGVVLASGLIAMLVPGLGFVGTVDIVILDAYEKLCRWFEKLPYCMWNPGRPQVWKVVLYYIIWIFVVCGLPILRHCLKKRMAFTDIRMMLLGMGIAVGILGMPQRAENRMTFLDVGQGDGMCLQLASGEVYLFDCGSSSRQKIGEKVLLPFLKYYGISEIDAVFISHGDADHTNGLCELFALSETEHITIRQIVLPGLPADRLQEEFREVLQSVAQMQRIPEVTTIQSGVIWQSHDKKGDNATFLCLHPEGGRDTSITDGRKRENSGSSNAESECFYIAFEGSRKSEGERVSLLLTGDVEGQGEQELVATLQKYRITDIDVLKCPHHGSKGTTNEELLLQITPTYTIISCGKNNRYGHPHTELLDRLDAVHSKVYQTSYTGAVTMCVRSGKCKISTFQ